LTRKLIDIFSTSPSTIAPKWLFQTC
jgi:hypothetical protein